MVTTLRLFLFLFLLLASPVGIPMERINNEDVAVDYPQSNKVPETMTEPVCTGLPNMPPAHLGNVWQEPGIAYDSLFGVYAYSNAYRGKYQCTELAHRFLSETIGIPTRTGLGLGHAKTVLSGIFHAFGAKSWQETPDGCDVRIELNRNGASIEPPRSGSALSFETGKYGHVAIVRYVEQVDEDLLRLYLFEQHGFPKHQPEDQKDIRSIELRRDDAGAWSGTDTPGIGTPNYWLNIVYPGSE
ncbi:CHAP domain-containing protein [bacterium]|nr:CHAP domain-containing protein [bacterium]